MALEEYVAAVLADSPVAFWKLDETSGDPADSSGNGYDLTTTTGTPTYDQVGPIDSPSILYDGGEGHSRSTLVSTVTDNFTIEAWVKVPVITANDQLGVYNGNSGSNGWGFLIDSNRTFQGLAGGVAVLTSSTGALSSSVFKHVVVTRDAGTWKYYLDGAVDTANAGTSAPNTPSGGSTAVQGGATNVQGVYALVAIYETALSSTQVADHFAALASSFENTFEGGSDETTISTGNSGGASGVPFDAVENASGANTVVFDSARSVRGSYSCRMEVNGSGTCNVQWRGTAILKELSPIYTRHYVYFTGAPGTNSLRHIVLADATTLSRHADYSILTSGIIRLSDNAFTSADMSNALPTNEWVRLETRTLISATVGEMTIRMYNAAGTLVEEKAHTSNGSLDTLSGSESGADLVGFGQLTSNTSVTTWWMDDLAVGDDWLGSSVASQSYLLFPHRVM